MIEFVDRVAPGDLPPGAEAVCGGGTKARALDRFATTLDFPAWFGRNLDALADLLGERAGRRVRETGEWALVWRPAVHLVREHPAVYAALVAVLADVAEAPGRTVTVVGPDPGTLER